MLGIRPEERRQSMPQDPGRRAVAELDMQARAAVGIRLKVDRPRVADGRARHAAPADQRVRHQPGRLGLPFDGYPRRPAHHPVRPPLAQVPDLADMAHEAREVLGPVPEGVDLIDRRVHRERLLEGDALPFGAPADEVAYRAVGDRPTQEPRPCEAESHSHPASADEPPEQESPASKTCDQAGGRRPVGLLLITIRDGPLAAPPQTGNVRPLMALEPVFDCDHSRHPPDRVEQAPGLLRQDGPRQYDPAPLGAGLDGMRMRAMPSQFGAHPADQDRVIDGFAAKARGRRRHPSHGPVAQVPPRHVEAVLAHVREVDRLVPQQRPAAPAAIRIGQVRQTRTDPQSTQHRQGLVHADSSPKAGLPLRALGR
ncbi:hypothetical protein D3C86_598770 [compost metagenome]